MIRAAALLAASLVFITSVHAADKPKDGEMALQRKLHGAWKGPACGGDWTYKADGTFDVVHYSPGGNTLSGTWEVRWNALPMTLVRTCKTSDDPDLVGKTWEVKLVELDDEALAYQYPDQYPKGHVVRYTRVPAKKAKDKESKFCRYVERNPLRANLVSKAELWRWSSLWQRTNQGTDVTLSPWPLPAGSRWSEYVNQPETEAELAALRKSVTHGIPFGDADWAERTGNALGIETRIGPAGRPRSRW